MSDLEKLLSGTEVDGHKIGRSLGQGGFGEVFEASHILSGSRLAIKVLRQTHDPDASVDFQNEGLLLKQLLPCPGVVNFISTGTHRVALPLPTGASFEITLPFHSMALASGSLEELVEDPVTRTQLDILEVMRLWRSATKSLMQMHEHNVAHRDLKSGNCLMLVRNNTTSIQFGDLGRAKDVLSTPTSPPSDYLRGKGDLYHAPPEAIFWQAGDSAPDFFAADYYGLGSILAELIAGQSMSSLAIGDIGAASLQGLQDARAGRQRDLSVLEGRFEVVIASVAELVPKSIRDDVELVLQSLCHPMPGQRLLPSGFSKDRKAGRKLAWILRRGDIMIQRLITERREMRRKEKRAA